MRGIGRGRTGAMLGVAGVAVMFTAGPLAAADEPERLFSIQDPRIVESSGLTIGAAEDVLFTHGDAGRPAEVYAIDHSGRTLLTIVLRGMDNRDWEDIAAGTDELGRPALFVGDIGDAFASPTTRSRARRRFTLLRFAEPQLPERTGRQWVVVEDADRFPLEYADGMPRNAEALAVQPGSNHAFVVNKVRGDDRPADVWAAPRALRTDAINRLTRVGRVPVVAATAAAFSPDGALFAVRNHERAYLWRVPRGNVSAAVRAAPMVVPLPEQRQGESLTFSADGTALLVGSEGRGEPVWEVPLPATLAPPGRPGTGSSSPSQSSPSQSSPSPSSAGAVTASRRAATVQWPVLIGGVAAVVVGTALVGNYLRHRRR